MRSCSRGRRRSVDRGTCRSGIEPRNPCPAAHAAGTSGCRRGGELRKASPLEGDSQLSQRRQRLDVARCGKSRPRSSGRSRGGSRQGRQTKARRSDILYHRGRARLLVSKDSYAEMFKVDPQSWRVHRDRSIRLVMRRFMAVASAKALQVRRSAESGSSVHPSNSDERR